MDIGHIRKLSSNPKIKLEHVVLSGTERTVWPGVQRREIKEKLNYFVLLVMVELS